MVRVVNAAPTTQTINVSAGFKTIATNVGVGQATEPVSIEAGENAIEVSASGSSGAPLLETSANFDGTTALLIVLSGANGLEIQLLPDNIQPLSADESGITVINLLDTGVRVQQDAGDFLPEVAPGATANVDGLSTGDSELQFITGSSTTPFSVLFTAQNNVTVILSGTSEAPNVTAFNTRAPGRSAARVIHASTTLSPFDAYLNSEPLALNAEYGRPTERKDFSSGSYELSIYAAGSDPAADSALLTQPVSLDEATNAVLIVLGEEGSLTLAQGTEDLSPLPEGQFNIGFVNTVATAPTVGVETSSGPLPNLPGLIYGDGPSAIQLGMGPYNFQFLRSGSGGDDNRTVEIVQNIQFEAGFYYLYLVTGRMDNTPLILSENVGIDSSLTVTSADDLATQVAAGSAQIHFINAIQDGSAVDFWAGETLATANVPYGDASELIEIPQSSTVSVMPAGLPDVAQQVSLTSGERFTVIAYGENLSQAQLLVIDDSSLIFDSSTRARLINVSTNADVSLGLGFSAPDPTPMPGATAIPANVDLRRTIPFGVETIVENITGGVVATPILMPAALTDLEIIDSAQDMLAFTIANVTLESGHYDVIAYEEPETTRIEAFVLKYPR